MEDETREPSEEELHAAFEDQLRHVSVEDVILQTVATLVNLGARRLGLIPEAGEDPAAGRDLGQAKLAIDGARALAPICPEDHQESIRQALSQLQMAYARTAQEGAPGEPEAASSGPTPPPSPGAGTPQEPPSPPPASGDTDADTERAKARSKIWTPPGA